MKAALLVAVAFLAQSAHAQFTLRIQPLAITNNFRLNFACPAGFGSSVDVEVSPYVSFPATNSFILQPDPQQFNSPIRRYDFQGFNPSNLFFRVVARR